MRALPFLLIFAVVVMAVEAVTHESTGGPAATASAAGGAAPGAQLLTFRSGAYRSGGPWA